jgi:hypothetical protein
VPCYAGRAISRGMCQSICPPSCPSALLCHLARAAAFFERTLAKKRSSASWFRLWACCSALTDRHRGRHRSLRLLHRLLCLGRQVHRAGGQPDRQTSGSTTCGDRSCLRSKCHHVPSRFTLQSTTAQNRSIRTNGWTDRHSREMQPKFKSTGCHYLWEQSM